MAEFTTRFVAAHDKAAWRGLFDGYADFYGIDMDDATAERVWRWLLDPGHVLEGLLACDPEGRPAALAHVRACPRPLAGNEIGFLDDLFVLPAVRGSGAGDALFTALKALAAERDWPAIRWITQHFNARARGFYDRYTSGPTEFVLYQWQPDSS